MQYRFSGHETFPCRYAWLPKAFGEIRQNPKALADDQEAMIALGVGKNMVRAIRFWLQIAGMAAAGSGGSFTPTPFGKAVLSPRGEDPFLEDIRTLWLIHWQIATHVEQPLFAWEFLLNRWPHPEFSRSVALAAFKHEARLLGKDLSEITLEQHFDVFLHSYVPTRGRKGEVLEDNLDCPLVELELIQRTGERPTGKQGHREAVYAFRREEKPEITPPLFIYCLDDFWRRWRPSEQTLTLKDVALAPGSPGQIFKLPEDDVRDRLERIGSDSEQLFGYRESASLQHVIRNRQPEGSLLGRLYEREPAHA
ncbi:MAG: DUF4007 family protein [Tepidisphaeraceae bacterium]